MTRLEHSIRIVLRAGVIASSACMAFGVAVSLAGAAPGVAELLLRLGLLILLCTPGARVVISTIEYASERDWRFAALTAIVLVELMASAVAALVFNRRM